MKEHRNFGGAYSAQLCIGATTAINALGFSAYETWAFRRAELTGYGESPFRLPNGERATMSYVSTLPPTSFGVTRMRALVEATLSPLATLVADRLGTHARVGVSVALPERMNGRHPNRRFAFEARQIELEVQQPWSALSMPPQLNVQSGGHAASARGLLWACMKLLADELDVAIVGGVDTYYDPDVMQSLMLDRRVYSSGDLDAIIPGEGAAFALIGRQAALRAAGFASQCRLDGVSVGEEPCYMGLDTPCMGLGLSRTATPLIDRLREERRTLDWVLGDVTNEDYRAHEFQLAFPRITRDVVPAALQLEFLPMSMGDLGAATLPTGLAIACESFVRGDPAAETCMLLSSSVGADRGAVLACAMREGR